MCYYASGELCWYKSNSNTLLTHNNMRNQSGTEGFIVWRQTCSNDSTSLTNWESSRATVVVYFFVFFFFFPGYRPVLILQARQGALELLLVLVLQVGQQHVLSAGWLMVQGWAGVTQEVLIFIPESPTQETAHWATSTQPPAAQSRAKDNTGRAKAWPSAAEERYYSTGNNEARLARMEWDTMRGRVGGVCARQIYSPIILGCL